MTLHIFNRAGRLKSTGAVSYIWGSIALGTPDIARISFLLWLCSRWKYHYNRYSDGGDAHYVSKSRRAGWSPNQKTKRKKRMLSAIAHKQVTVFIYVLFLFFLHFFFSWITWPLTSKCCTVHLTLMLKVFIIHLILYSYVLELFETYIMIKPKRNDN